MSATAREQRRYVKDVSRRRRRGGAGRGPVVIQRMAAAAVRAGGRVRDGARAVVAGDRPFVAGLVGLLALSVIMLSGPLQSYWQGRERVELLEAKHDALTAEIATLEDRASELKDPEEIELLAREQQGYVRPGEVPYAIVPPEVDNPQITAPRDVESQPDPWYRRLWDSLADWLG